jgi:hypothetical protein
MINLTDNRCTDVPQGRIPPATTTQHPAGEALRAGR